MTSNSSEQDIIQDVDGVFNAKEVRAVVENCLRNYPIDDTKIILTGNSFGAWGCVNYLASYGENSKVTA